jgi:hypothetical protein
LPARARPVSRVSRTSSTSPIAPPRPGTPSARPGRPELRRPTPTCRSARTSIACCAAI